jgi:hypothetical protein
MDMLSICFGGIKSTPKSIKEFCKLCRVFLAKAHMITLPIITQHSVLENQPVVQNLHYASLRKTLVLKILQQTLLFGNIMIGEGDH